MNPIKSKLDLHDRPIGDYRMAERRGFAAAELIVATVLLMAAMTFFTTICFRVDRVWKDITHQRIAVNELANQLEALSLMPASEIDSELLSLRISEHCQQALNSPKLTGEAIEDGLGIRINLQIQWKRTPKRQPVELSGWLIDKNDRKEP